MPEEFAGVTPMLPEWPEVRCDTCRRTYTIPVADRFGLVTGSCPRCGHERFSTTMTGTGGVLLLDAEPFPLPPRQENPE